MGGTLFSPSFVVRKVSDGTFSVGFRDVDNGVVLDVVGKVVLSVVVVVVVVDGLVVGAVCVVVVVEGVVEAEVGLFRFVEDVAFG